VDLIIELTALCRQGLHHLSWLPASLPLSLFLAGLAGSLVHCVGMCGPFVLGQVIADTGPSGGRYGEWQRLSGAALMPYHLGRLTTYIALGAFVGAATAVFTATTGFAWLSGAMLALAAILMIVQALGLSLGATSPLSGLISRVAGTFVSSPEPANRYALGLVLGFLPCGLLYGALAAAAGTASVLQGALAMMAFGLGTVPALVGAGWLGMILRRRLQGLRRWVAAPLLVANAFTMLMVASQRL
jgi:sulfite exporter TauE/SafE